MSSCATTATIDHGAEHEPDGQERDRECVLAQVAERREEGGAVEKRRKHRDEDEVRRQLYLRDPGDEPEPEAAERRAGSDTGCSIELRPR